MAMEFIFLTAEPEQLPSIPSFRLLCLIRLIPAFEDKEAIGHKEIKSNGREI